jgi:hypothetical protein
MATTLPDMYDGLLRDPASLAEGCYHDIYALSRTQVETIQLEGARRSFAELRPRLPVLDKLAKEQGVDRIETLDDLAPLLFAHTVYKSYPLALLERGNFARLTRWLDGLTIHELRGLDASGIDTIDAWLDLLDAQTPLSVFHGSGTTGKLAFVPRTKDEYVLKQRMTARVYRDHFGPSTGPDVLETAIPVISPGYRYGAGNSQRTANLRVTMYARSDDNALFMYPHDRFSADIASLAGRLRAAEARGEQGGLELSPALLRRRDEVAQLERERPQKIARFFELAVERFGGRDVLINAVWPIMFECAEAGLARGVRGVFGPNSVLVTGGGPKGRVLPPDWREQIVEFLGFDRSYEMYGMSEWMSVCWRCEQGNYHIPPTLVSFVLDPVSGRPLPRADGVTGRFAALDLLASTYWGGLVSGDEVTVGGWSEHCACGRTGAYVEPTIRRYSEKEGGDDRVLCSGAPEAHDNALAFLAHLSE